MTEDRQGEFKVYRSAEMMTVAMDGRGHKIGSVGDGSLEFVNGVIQALAQAEARVALAKEAATVFTHGNGDAEWRKGWLARWASLPPTEAAKETKSSDY